MCFAVICLIRQMKAISTLNECSCTTVHRAETLRKSKTDEVAELDVCSFRSTFQTLLIEIAVDSQSSRCRFGSRIEGSHV